VTFGEATTLMFSSSTCSGPILSNKRIPSPNSNGARWISSSSSSPALMTCWTVSAPPATLTFFSPAATFACCRALSMPSVTKVNVVPLP
jgi:hypothetical protein